MTNQVRTIAPSHLAVLKTQLKKSSFKKAKKLSETHDCSKMRYSVFLSKI